MDDEHDPPPAPDSPFWLTYKTRIGRDGKVWKQTSGGTGYSFNRDRGEWVRRQYKVDYERDWYDEVITTADGDVIHECHEPLSQHRGRGAAARPADEVDVPPEASGFA